MNLHNKSISRTLVKARQFYYSVGFYRVLFHLGATFIFMGALYKKNASNIGLNTILLLSVIYLLLSIFVAINNLTLYKKYILVVNASSAFNARSIFWSGISKGAVRYFFLVLCLAFGGAYLLDFIANQYIATMLVDYKTPIIIVGVTYLGICLLTTGLIYIDKQRDDINWLIKKNATPNQSKEVAPVAEVMVAINHIKIGNKTKFNIIKLEDIIYIEADGKEPAIHSVHGTKYGNISINEYDKQLSDKDFIRVHRRYIIAKSRVVRRDKKEFVLSDGTKHTIKIPIGDSFLTAIDNDAYLGFRTPSLKGDAVPDNTKDLPNTSQSATE